MTFVEHLREVARQDSMALRAFAAQGRTTSPRPASAVELLDSYDERRKLHTVRLMSTTPEWLAKPRTRKKAS